MKNILVAIDFDQSESLLIDKAYALAQAFHSKVWLLHVAPPDPDFVGYKIGPQYISDSVATELREEHRALQKFASQLNDKGINSEALLIQGGTIEIIIEESKKLNIDLIITGHHKHGFIYNALVGSTSIDIINDSKIPVLIVPIPKHD